MTLVVAYPKDEIKFLSYSGVTVKILDSDQSGWSFLLLVKDESECIEKNHGPLKCGYVINPTLKQCDFFKTSYFFCFFKSYKIIYCSVCVCLWVHVSCMVPMWRRPETNLQRSVFSYDASPGDWTQVTRFDRKCLYPLSPLSVNPIFYEFDWE